MLEEFKEEKKVSKKTKKDLVEIEPLKDFEFCFGKETFKLKKGEKILMKQMFLENLKTEKVI